MNKMTMKIERVKDGKVVDPKVQTPLFGEVDEIVNSLELYRRGILADIRAYEKTITKAESSLNLLNESCRAVEKSIKAAKKIAEEKNAEGKK